MEKYGLKKESVIGTAITPPVFISEEERRQMRKTLTYLREINGLNLKIIGCHLQLLAAWVFSATEDVKLRRETLIRERENIEAKPEILFFKPDEL